jgi:hypothetical protein
MKRVAISDESRSAQRMDSEGKMARKEKKEAKRRMRRRDNGMATTAGISSSPKVEPIARTLALLTAALRAWEARNEHLRSRSVWRRRVNGEAKEI